MAKKFFTWLLLFIGIYLILQSFQQQAPTEKAFVDDIVLVPSEDSYTLGDTPLVEVYNNLDRTLVVPSECPSEPLEVARYRNGVWENLTSEKGVHVACDSVSHSAFVQPEFFQIEPDESVSVDYSPWKDQLFEELGKYRVTLSTEVEGVPKSFSAEFSIEERGFFSSVMFRLFFQPIFNFLLLLASVMPGYNFGLAVIALTLIIRLILLVPNHKALKSQKAMMKIQPELEAIKRKHKGDQQRISMETMELWKKHRVNPIGGCLPLLIQLPILIALFYVIKDGFTPYQGYMVYEALSYVDLSRINTDFYGILNLEEVNATWLPISVGLIQFIQMKLSFSRKNITAPHGKDEKTTELAQKEENSDPTAALQDPLRMMNKTMLYFMPVMMAFMVATLPSGVGLYLAVSTLFGILQQVFVNKAA